MKDQVVMSPNNGQLALAIPLFRRHYDEEIANLAGYTVSLTKDKPVAYALDCGPEVQVIQVFNAEWVQNNLEFLGDL